MVHSEPDRTSGRPPLAGPVAAATATPAGESEHPVWARITSWRRAIATSIAIVLLLAFMLVFAVGWFASERAVHPRANSYRWRVEDFPNLQPQDVIMPSRTGVTLAGRFFPGQSRATIILSHGYGENQDQMLPYADFLNRAGFSVVTYDMRNRGRSTGEFVTIGALEQDDLVSVVDAVTTLPGVDPDRIGAFGVSLGGSVSIMATAKDPRVKAVVDDCGFSDAPSIVTTSFEHFVGVPAWPFAPAAIKIAEWRAGVSIDDVRPVDVIGRISPRPVFIIHGTLDTAVPPANSERNFASAGEPKRIWWVAGARHAESRDIAGAEYDRQVAEFFRAALGD